MTTRLVGSTSSARPARLQQTGSSTTAAKGFDTATAAAKCFSMMSEPTPSLPLLGGCQCGAVRYALHSWPVKPHVCHCRMCQKASGAPFMAFAELPLAAIAWTREQPAWFRSSQAAERGFCPACGTSLHFRYVEGDQIDVALASLDRPDLVVPEQQFGCESRLAWMEALDALPASTTEATTPPEALATYASLQHPDE